MRGARIVHCRRKTCTPREYAVVWTSVTVRPSALSDRLGAGFTLLRFADLAVDGLVAAAERRGLPLTVLDVRDPDVARLYERPLVLVRPDQHVAWRGTRDPEQPLAVVDRVRGAGDAAASPR